MSKSRYIGSIGNYYGCLEVKKEDGKFYWGIEDWSGIGWEEIPKNLFNELNAFEDQREMEESR